MPAASATRTASAVGADTATRIGTPKMAAFWIVSVEMIQKAAIFGVPILVAVSAPTALAVRVAEAAGITLAAVARHDGFEIFTHADRLLDVEFEQPAAAD